MNARVTRKALLLLATSLLLAGCVDNPTESNSEISGSDNTSITDNSQTSDDSYTSSSESSSKSSVDYTQGWDPKIDAEIRRNLGGEQYSRCTGRV